MTALGGCPPDMNHTNVTQIIHISLDLVKDKILRYYKKIIFEKY